VGLTIDDGPTASTGDLLTILRSHGATATFFNVGAQAQKYPDAVKAEAAIGQVGNHTYSHSFLDQLTDKQAYGELLGTNQIKDATASHEVAHEWFYGLVGNDQARDPWIDEAFATYAEALDHGTAHRYLTARIPADGIGRAGAPMTYWEGRPAYFRSVYVQGAAALLRARAGRAVAFDQQVRCYLARGAHRIATTRDVARSIPLAVAQLQKAGALSRS